MEKIRRKMEKEGVTKLDAEIKVIEVDAKMYVMEKQK